MTSPFGEELLRGWLADGEKGAALDQWICWNNSPSRHVPLATLMQFFPEKFYQILSQDHQVRSQVDAILRAKLSWTAPVSWMPEDPLWKISLAAPLRLQRLAFLAAALSMKEELSKIIDGALVRKLRQEIGADIMEFALLSGSLSKYFFVPLTADLARITEPLVALQERAVLFIENAFSAKEVGVQQRIASKMPGCFSTGIGKPASPLAAKTEELLCKLWKETSSWL